MLPTYVTLLRHSDTRCYDGKALYYYDVDDVALRYALRLLYVITLIIMLRRYMIYACLRHAAAERMPARCRHCR